MIPKVVVLLCVATYVHFVCSQNGVTNDMCFATDATLKVCTLFKKRGVIKYRKGRSGGEIVLSLTLSGSPSIVTSKVRQQYILLLYGFEESCILVGRRAVH